MRYKNTFIKVAKDCPVSKSEIPVSKRAVVPIHVFQYELLSKFPYKFGHEELVFEVHLKRQGLPENLSDSEAEEIWERLFSKGHPCMRASALTKRYGFGVHYDEDGKIALYPMESEAYAAFLKNTQVEKITAMARTRK